MRMWGACLEMNREDGFNFVMKLGNNKETRKHRFLSYEGFLWDRGVDCA